MQEENQAQVSVLSTETIEEEYRNWKHSVLYIAIACVFLIFIDVVTRGGINWSCWAVVPTFLFAKLAPYLPFKFGQWVI